MRRRRRRLFNSRVALTFLTDFDHRFRCFGGQVPELLERLAAALFDPFALFDRFRHGVTSSNSEPVFWGPEARAAGAARRRFI